MKKPDRTVRIAVLQHLALFAGRQITAGILKFAATRPNWDVRIYDCHCSEGDFRYDRDWQADGLISGANHDDIAIVEAPSLMKIKNKIYTCVAQSERTNAHTASITCDNEQIGSAAARFFLKRHLKNFGFVGAIHPSDWDESRFTGYRDTLNRHNLTCHRFTPTSDPDAILRESKELVAWLRALPKPCGIFASYDHRARHILQTCRLAGFSTLGQIQILGTDNEEWICEQTRPTLSSIEIDFETCGYRAAEMIERMINGETIDQPSPTVGIKEIVERMSTSDLRGDANRATLAHNLLRKHATEGITITDIARRLGCSRRLLELSYRQVYERTAKEDLMHFRLQRVCRLLQNPNIPIGDIAAQCGFTSSNYLKSAFRRQMNMTMSAYRTFSLTR